MCCPFNIRNNNRYCNNNNYYPLNIKVSASLSILLFKKKISHRLKISNFRVAILAADTLSFIFSILLSFLYNITIVQQQQQQKRYNKLIFDYFVYVILQFITFCNEIKSKCYSFPLYPRFLSCIPLY